MERGILKEGTVRDFLLGACPAAALAAGAAEAVDMRRTTKVHARSPGS